MSVYREALKAFGMTRLSDARPLLAVLAEHNVDVGPVGRFLLEGWEVVDYHDREPKPLGITLYAPHRVVAIRSSLALIPGAYREALAHEAAHAIASAGGFDQGKNGHNTLWGDTARTNGATYGAERIGPEWLTFALSWLEALEAFENAALCIGELEESGPQRGCATHPEGDEGDEGAQGEAQGDEPTPLGDEPSDEGEGEPSDEEPTGEGSGEGAEEGDEPSEGGGGGGGEGDEEPTEAAVRGGSKADGSTGPRLVGDTAERVRGSSPLGSLRTRYTRT